MSVATGRAVARNAALTLRATVAGAVAGSTRVAFVLDGATARPVATDTSSPYEVSWRVPMNTSLGSHTLTAVVTDGAGRTAASPPVAITVRR